MYTYEKMTSTYDREPHRDVRVINSGHLNTISMTDLFDTVYESRPPIIDGLLYPGTYLFVGAPKVGKSFLVGQIAYHVSTGTPMWDYAVRQGTVLYLALEDTPQRIQIRMSRMFGTEVTEHLYFATIAPSVDGGLEDQLLAFLEDYPDTRLVIIDTLQKVRDSSGERYSYGDDYQIVGDLKRFADEHGLCVLLVHHTRKQKSGDPFDMISGTNGLLGAADAAFILQKEQRTSTNATLSVTGRDQQEMCMHLNKNMETLRWELESVETDLWKPPADPLLEAVAKLVASESPEWEGSPTQLVGILPTDLASNALTRHLNVNASRLREEYHVEYQNKARHEGRRIKLRYLAEEAAVEAKTEISDNTQCDGATMRRCDDEMVTDIDDLITSLTDEWAVSL